MRHVLFVDDDLNVLAGLKRMLRGLRQEWEMGFVNGGESALAYLAEHHVDVVITDMRMPGMDGAQLLTAVVAHHPGVVRIALSGQSDQETLVKAAGLVHQYLSKPCAAETLTSTVRRACALRDHLSNGTLKRLVSSLRSIPSLPTNYQDVLKEVTSPEPSLQRVSEIISRDAAMTAKVLQLVNSSFFGNPRRVTNVLEAISLLGVNTVHGLVLSVGVFSQFDPRRVTAFSVDGLMAHSLRVAALAKQIAAQHSKDVAVCNDAYVAGLLHDVGKLVLAVSLPEAYGDAVAVAQEGGFSLNDVEREVFSADHADVGAYILSLWGLPTTLTEAVAFHHCPANSMATGFTPLLAVHVANALSHADRSGAAGSATLGVDENYVQSIGVLDQLASWRALSGATGRVEAAT